MYTQSRQLLESRFFVAFVGIVVRGMGQVPAWIIDALRAESQCAADSYYNLRSHGNAGDAEVFEAVLSAYREGANV